VDRGHEILEHTADLGVRAWGPSLEVAFEEAARALAEILDVVGTGSGTVREIRLEAGDAAALLVDLLNELVFLVETEDVALAQIRVLRATDSALGAEVTLVSRDREPQGMVVKAATYHALAVQRAEGRAEVRVFLDV
jgi:SHS2 domain-containing protein